MIARHQCQMDLCHCGCTYILPSQLGEVRMGKMSYLLECPDGDKIGFGRKERNRATRYGRAKHPIHAECRVLSVTDEVEITLERAGSIQ